MTVAEERSGRENGEQGVCPLPILAQHARGQKRRITQD